ncbi:hypothetical protein [Stieleria varia]|uniref:Periplasmic protein n=1 Tax=Stieleria varia TaxID=2528005 RepID=A0A5C6B503_9BACT|nr:hypothetical protein [Stieleria varia]TWU06389.1 hypothetical protein Pla52n_21100 [Stieleria varia]
MKYLLTVCLCLVAATARSQDAPAKPAETIANPFDQPIEDTGGYEMMDGYGSGMMEMGMGMEAAPSPDDMFRANLPRAIEQLKRSKTPEERAALQNYIREAFENRYDRMMNDRKKDIERLRASLAELESDLRRRTAAKDRVVQLQLQSVQLAAEGLLELNDLQGVGGQNVGGPGMGSGSYEGSMGMGN